MFAGIGHQLALGIGTPIEWVAIFVVALIVFGPDKLPEVGRQLGKAMRDLRKMTDEITGVTQSIHREITDTAGSVRRSLDDSYRSAIGGSSSAPSPFQGEGRGEVLTKGPGDVADVPAYKAAPGTEGRTGVASPVGGLRLSTLPDTKPAEDSNGGSPADAA